jgi:hypothetical protein
MMLEPRLIELLNQTHNAVEMRKDLALIARTTLAVDLEIEINFTARCLYLLHPRQAVRSLFHREHFLRILLHAAVAFPELERDVGAVFLKIRAEVGCSALCQRRLQSREMLTVPDGSRAIDHDGAPLVLDGSSQTAAEGPADFLWGQEFKC